MKPRRTKVAKNVVVLLVVAVVVLGSWLVGEDSPKAWTVYTAEAARPSKSEEWCLERGFVARGAELRCDVCKKVGDAVSADAESDCKSCCASPADKAAILMKMNDVFGAPGVLDFVNNAMQKMNSVKTMVSIRDGGLQGKPKLMLMDARDRIMSQVTITSWKASDIESFLRNWLPAMPY